MRMVQSGQMLQARNMVGARMQITQPTVPLLTLSPSLHALASPDNADLHDVRDGETIQLELELGKPRMYISISPNIEVVNPGWIYFSLGDIY
jgi:hypothetical protein